jgi:hypothetical protein
MMLPGQEELLKEYGIPVQCQRFWLWAKRQNNTYRPSRPLTHQEETTAVSGILEQISCLTWQRVLSSCMNTSILLCKNGPSYILSWFYHVRRRKRNIQIILLNNFDNCEGEPWRSGKAVALWPWGHGFKYWKQPLAEMQGKIAYIRSKVVRPLPGLCTSGSYVHWAALFLTTLIIVCLTAFTMDNIDTMVAHACLFPWPW